MITEFFSFCRSLATSRLTNAMGISLFLVTALAGCSGGPSRIQAPTFDPAGAASKAMEIYDTDGDGFVAGEELEKAPGLKAALKNLDTDGDGKVSEAEIADRVRAWEKQNIGLMGMSCDLYLDGKPLAGAIVTFEPEEFLAGAVQEGVGESNMLGIVSPKVPKEKRPTPDTPPGMQAGIYKVRISKMEGGKEIIPSRYNTETTLGQEVSKDDWAINNKAVRFEIKSK